MADNNFKRIYESYYSKYDNGIFDSRWAESEEIEKTGFPIPDGRKVRK